jgi:purine-binding chemotaxis protein CheW
VQALLLPLAEDLYALPLHAVREVLAAPEATRLPGAPPAALGVFNLRGEVVPMLDTAALLGLEPGAASEWVAVTDTSAGPAGLTALRLPQRARLGDRAGASKLPATVGRFAVGERVATLIDVDALVGRLS